LTSRILCLSPSLSLLWFIDHLLVRIISCVDSGGVCVNDTIMHAVGPLPFGGVGASGIGAYHGIVPSTTLALLSLVLKMV
jgi:delta 1-pyrroline-5-carboxylate dehydrogenase